MTGVLVTGGAGFLGSHLCERLLQRGHQVWCIDNFYTGSRNNIAHLLASPNFSLVELDITQPDVASHLRFPVSHILNFACPASPVHYQFDPVFTIRTNVHGTLHMLELARAQQASFLQASTSEVYGDPDVHPQPESYWGRVNPIGYRSCYDEGKRCAETLCFDYHRQYGVDIRVVRIFNTYGPRMQVGDGRVVSNFISQALAGRDITLQGDGLQTRSFCYVDDMVGGILRMMDQPGDFTGPVNLGNPVECSMLALAQRVLQLTGSRSRLVFKPLPPDDPRQRKPDISLARERLKWEPVVALDEGLQQTIDYFRTVL